MTLKKSKKEIGLSEAFSELEKITAEFEGGKVDLEKGIPKFRRGLELARFLKKRLTKIENEIEEVKAEFKDLTREEVREKEEKTEEAETDGIPF